ncbi:MAG TPA: methyl-accepting chemotaxis protein [Opitutaceae bacterium]|nr:methyl-accepting chemotaxis protein [Opitutaceae bacterium]
MKALTLRAQLVLAFSIVAMIPLVGGAIGIYAQRNAAGQAQHLLAESEQVRNMVDAARRAHVRFQPVALAPAAGAADRQAQAASAIQATDASLKDAATSAVALGVDASAVASLREALRSTVSTDVAATSATNARLESLVADLGQAGAARLAADRRKLETTGAWLERLMLFGTITGILIGGFFGWMTSNGVVRHLRGIADRMQERTTTVASAANQVAASSASVASTSSQQASAIESSGAAVTQVSARVKENADRAAEARKVSERSRAAADESAAEISSLQAAMHDSMSANRNITKIIKSIDEIAFQTNLLALNAAVEAARAGESGAGFAVVADEVRNLAQRSAQAARESAAKIEEATSKSSNGAALADRVGGTLQNLLENTRTVDVLVREIAAASQEQADGLQQVVASMERVDRLTQSNAAAADETAGAARALNDEAGELRRELSAMFDRRAQVATATAAAPVEEKERAVLAA